MKPAKLRRTVYLRAIEVLKKRGWHQGAFADGSVLGGKGACCMVGACNVALHGDPWAGTATSYKEISKAIGMRMVGDWNDEPDRTKRQVIAALRKAAKLAGNKRVTP